MSAIHTEPVILDGKSLTIDAIVGVARFGRPVELAAGARDRIQHCRRFVEERIAERAVMYGITTGIGELSEASSRPIKRATSAVCRL
jgi:histidine ammonia-lyase